MVFDFWSLRERERKRDGGIYGKVMIYENINKEREEEGKWEEARKVLDNFRVEFTATTAAAFSYLHYNSSLSTR